MHSTKRRSIWTQVGLWVCVALMTLHLSPRTAHIYSLWWQTRAEVHALEAERQTLIQEQVELKAQIARVSTPLGKETLARERGWLKSDELPLQIQK